MPSPITNQRLEVKLGSLTTRELHRLCMKNSIDPNKIEVAKESCEAAQIGIQSEARVLSFKEKNPNFCKEGR